ncbi:glycoside hydrolase family 76 protein [Butyrivibrio sp. MC2013]|uniref:glycoside hydrolase family 76 protein n=1 Tax=Butyrivibrio sp. MC2013 TaxID=1280686 RepID=UPI000687580A|nr:glycoside hydrolase family 76 protein [Butyrivibrio sp. MC2013]
MKDLWGKRRLAVSIIAAAVLLLCTCLTAYATVKIKSKKEEGAVVQRAEEALQKFTDRFYKLEEDGQRGQIVGGAFWTEAEMFEIVVDAYEKTGDEKYHTLMDQLYHGFIDNYGDDWAYNTFNDDIMWMTIGCARAYELTGEQEYLDRAVTNFNLVYDRAWTDDLGGGLLWKTDRTCKNACINGPATIAACLLNRITGEEVYLEKALKIYQWEVDTLYQENGAVYDNIEADGTFNTWCSTYNQGTFIGASQLLHELTGDEKYLDNAIAAADYTMNDMYQKGVINNEDEGGDLPGFKGILARWLGKLVIEEGQEQYKDWMKLNADTAWSNQNSKGMIWTLWGEKSEETFYMPWGCSAAIAQFFAVIGM